MLGLGTNARNGFCVGHHAHQCFVLLCLQGQLLWLQLRVWRRGGSAVGAMQAKPAKVAIQDLTRNAFREDVSWILSALYLEQCKIASSQSFLDP